MHGFKTHSYLDLVARHHRPWGSADGRLRGRARHGECAWILHYGFAWVFLRSLKVARVPPVGLSGAAFLFGYLRAAFRSVPQVDDRRLPQPSSGASSGHACWRPVRPTPASDGNAPPPADGG